MRIKTQEHTTEEKSVVVYYQLWLSANETYCWANRPNNSWPCSELSNHRLMICVDRNGLCDLTIDGNFKNIDNTELSAIVSDYLPADCRHLWPCWEQN